MPQTMIGFQEDKGWNHLNHFQHSIKTKSANGRNLRICVQWIWKANNNFDLLRCSRNHQSNLIIKKVGMKQHVSPKKLGCCHRMWQYDMVATPVLTRTFPSRPEGCFIHLKLGITNDQDQSADRRKWYQCKAHRPTGNVRFSDHCGISKGKKSVSSKGSIMSWTNEKADVLVLHTWFPN